MDNYINSWEIVLAQPCVLTSQESLDTLSMQPFQRGHCVVRETSEHQVTISSLYISAIFKCIHPLKKNILILFICPQEFPDILVSLWILHCIKFWMHLKMYSFLNSLKLSQIRKTTYVSVEFLQRSRWCKLQLHVYYGQQVGKCMWWRASSPSAGMLSLARSWFVSVEENYTFSLLN